LTPSIVISESFPPILDTVTNTPTSINTPTATPTSVPIWDLAYYQIVRPNTYTVVTSNSTRFDGIVKNTGDFDIPIGTSVWYRVITSIQTTSLTDTTTNSSALVVGDSRGIDTNIDTSSLSGGIHYPI